MKNRALKITFILVSTLVLSLLLMTNVRAEITWNAESNTVTIPCGESIDTYVDIDEWVDTTGRAEAMNQYSIQGNEGTQIFTGWNNPINNWNPNSSYYPWMKAVTDTLGQQVITIRFTPGGWGSTPVDTTLTVNCVASDDLKTVVEALGGEMPDAYTLNSDDVYTDLDDLTADEYEAILDAEDAYNALNDAEKAIVDGLMNEKLGMTADEVFQAADDGLERIADEFVDSTRLNDMSVSSLEEAREILVNATTLGDEFDSLSPRTKSKVLAKLSDYEGQFEDWDDVKEACQEIIDIIDAELFLNNYIDFSDDEIDEEKVLAGEETWNGLNDNVKDIINEILEEAEGIEKTYPELLKTAKANKFLKDNLTDNGKVIVEANNSNYQQILDAEDDYEALSDEVKEEVNRILTELGNTTYPELLNYAQKLAPTPKTGDMATIMIAILMVSVIGLAVTFIKRK